MIAVVLHEPQDLVNIAHVVRALKNFGSGVHILDGTVLIGQISYGNLISGNGQYGVQLDAPAIVQANLIGVDASGANALPTTNLPQSRPLSFLTLCLAVT